MAKHEFKFSLSTPWLFAVAFGLGVCLGAPMGVAVFQLVWGHATPGIHQVVLSLFGDDETVCVNGVAYAPHNGEFGSPWNGIYEPVQKAQPTLIGEDGQRILRPVIPTPCKIARG